MRRQPGGIAVLVVVFALLAGGCGGGKKSSASPPPPAAATTTTAPADQTTTTKSSTPSTAKPSFASTQNCLQLASLAAKVTQSVVPGASGKLDPNKFADVLEKLADAAPSAIKADFKTFADAYAGFVKLYGSSGFTPGKTPTPAQLAKFSAAAQKLATPKVRAATQHLEAWGERNCKGFKSP